MTCSAGGCDLWVQLLLEHCSVNCTDRLSQSTEPRLIRGTQRCQNTCILTRFCLYYDTLDRHVSFMLLPHFSHISPKCAYRLFFSAYSGIFDGSFNISVSVIYFYYVSLPRPSGCQQNGTIHVSGPLWNEMWDLVSSNSVGLPYFRRIFGVYAVRIFFKCRIKLACLTWIGILPTTLTFLRWVTPPRVIVAEML